jgi:hypothetical protein
MIQLLPVGLDVLYAVDYTGAIDNFTDVQCWTSTQWINCENRDVLGGIAFMKLKCKEAGMESSSALTTEGIWSGSLSWILITKH